MIAAVRPQFRAVARAVVPEAAALAEEEWRELEAAVDAALARRPPGVVRQLRVFLRVLGLLTLVRSGRPLAAADPAAVGAVLAALQRSPLLLLRRGVWGLRTLVFMGYYARPAAAAALGYRASPRGWEARR